MHVCVVLLQEHFVTDPFGEEFMGYIIAASSDVGISKNVNQDSLLVEEAVSDKGPVLFAAICDGMGGLANGEYASAIMTYALSEWFENVFPNVLSYVTDMPSLDDLKEGLTSTIIDTDRALKNFAFEHGGAAVGTTITGVLLVGNEYFTVNVGDSRVYKIGKTAVQLTHDHSLVQRMQDDGEITAEEARHHPRRNVLLQCVGATGDVVPDYTTGTFGNDELFMLCCDGFRHELSNEEFAHYLSPQRLKTEADLKKAAVGCINLNKKRMEKDNISVVLIRKGKEYRYA